MMQRSQAPIWTKGVLYSAGVYNFLLGAFIVLSPLSAFDRAGMMRPNYPELWQSIGMFVAVWGIAYLSAARNPYQHWPVVLAGLLGKTIGAAGFVLAASHGRLPSVAAGLAITSELIWWVPFAAILHGGHRLAMHRKRIAAPEIMRMALRARTQHQVSLDELSRLSPVLLVFLRHAGCTFCREAMSDLSRQRRAIEAAGARLVMVHMNEEPRAAQFFTRYSLADLPRVSDPRRSLYRAFGLRRGSLTEVFGPKVWWRGFQAGILRRHSIGRLEGDGFQMPGVFLIYHGEVIRSYRHQSAADRPDYVRLVTDDSIIAS
ncbi:MAG: peroxiredoxin-like family protein [Bryobacteraceae bacterium]